MRSSLFIATIASLATVSFGAPTVRDAPVLSSRQYIDYGPIPAVNCSYMPAQCPKSGPSGKLVTPSAGQTLTTVWDNSGHFNFEYTPVRNAAVSGGTVTTTNIIVSLRRYFYGVPVFADDFIELGTFVVPASGNIVQNIALPARFYDGDNNEQNDKAIAARGQSNSGEFGLEIIEQQRYTQSGAPPSLIQFRSARPIINIAYTDN